MRTMKGGDSDAGGDAVDVQAVRLGVGASRGQEAENLSGVQESEVE